jgi:hypothetical protein
VTLVLLIPFVDWVWPIDLRQDGREGPPAAGNKDED